MLNNRINTIWLITALLLSSAVVTVAQRELPDWADARIRANKFPESIFLMGFSSGKNFGNEDAGQLLEKHLNNAINDLSTSVYINLVSSAEYDLVIQNTVTNEKFRKVSQSSSRANIANLQTDKFYHQSSKIAYAIAWVKKTDLETYNRSLLLTLVKSMQQKIAEAEQWKNSDKKLALRSYYECLKNSQQFEDAENVLIALKSLPDQKQSEAANQLKIKAKAGINELQNDQQLTLNESVNFICQGLTLMLNGLNKDLSLGHITYENSGQEGDFSARLKSMFEQNLTTQNIRINKNLSQSSLVLNGTYWAQEEYLKLFASVRERGSGEIIATAEGQVPVQYLKRANINYIPPLVAKLQQLGEMEITAEPTQFVAKSSELSNKKPRIRISSGGKPLEGVQVKFILMPESKILGQIKTNGLGQAEGDLSFLKPASQVQVIQAVVDLPAWLNLDTTLVENKVMLKKHLAPKTRILANIKGQSIFLQSEELDFGSKMPIPPISGAIKKVLTEKGIAFVNKLDQADYLLSVQSDSRPGPSGQIQFAYVDAKVSVQDLSSGQEIIQFSYKDEKDGGRDVRAASSKIYQRLAEELSQKVLLKLLRE